MKYKYSSAFLFVFLQHHSWKIFLFKSPMTKEEHSFGSFVFFVSEKSANDVTAGEESVAPFWVLGSDLKLFLFMTENKSVGAVKIFFLNLNTSESFIITNSAPARMRVMLKKCSFLCFLTARRRNKRLKSHFSSHFCF